MQDFRQEMLREIAKLPRHLTRACCDHKHPCSHHWACSLWEGGAGKGAGDTKAVQKAPPDDGCLTWEAYRTQFEMLARVNNWNEIEKATHLAVSLKARPALTVLSNISRDGSFFTHYSY